MTDGDPATATATKAGTDSVVDAATESQPRRSSRTSVAPMDAAPELMAPAAAADADTPATDGESAADDRDRCGGGDA
ncbi:hypothetical protein [Halobaculum sp. P14]|uniref:hypothetical protein n=1 Tax=Halobaculum sp. P14 TaxID=3421638 RepID=UPI003EBBC6D6